MDRQSLLDQNESFSGTMGVSPKNRQSGFLPAFRDEETGRVEIARFRDGSPAPMHLIAGLPQDWAISFDDDGDVAAVKASITAGFVRSDIFFTREQACAACAEQ